MPYLRMLRGERYHLIKNGDVPEVLWTRGNPVPEVDIPAKVIKRLGLLDRIAPTLNRQGEIVGEGPQFELLERLPEAGELDAHARLDALAAAEDEGEGEKPAAKGKGAKSSKAAPPAADPTQVE